MSAGLEIFELAILPSLLNNADVWIEMGKTARDKLENLQNTMFRYLFGQNKKQHAECENEQKQSGAELCQAQVKLGLAKIYICVQN